MKKFVNLSNHGSGAWGEAQTSAAKVYGDIVDVPYPQVPTDLDENQFLELVESTVASVLAHEPAMVMCQGEMTTCFSIVLSQDLHFRLWQLYLNERLWKK